MEQVFDEALSLGITSMYNSLTSSRAIRAYQAMKRAGRLRVRMGIIASGREDGLIFPPELVQDTDTIMADTETLADAAEQPMLTLSLHFGDGHLEHDLIAAADDDAVDDLVDIAHEARRDIVGLLQSPAKNLIAALQSNAGQKVAGLVKAIETSKS